MSLTVVLINGFGLFFSDYWLVVKEIQDLCQNSSDYSSEGLRYIQGKADTFGGNLTTNKRFSFFDHSNDSMEVPCGFFKPFPISNSGKYNVSIQFTQYTLFQSLVFFYSKKISLKAKL